MLWQFPVSSMSTPIFKELWRKKDTVCANQTCHVTQNEYCTHHFLIACSWYCTLYMYMHTTCCTCSLRATSYRLQANMESVLREDHYKQTWSQCWEMFHCDSSNVKTSSRHTVYVLTILYTMASSTNGQPDRKIHVLVLGRICKLNEHNTSRCP